MATAEKTQSQQKQFQVPDDVPSDEDYDSADDYSDESDEEPAPAQNQQLQRRRRQQQQPQPQPQKQQDELDEYSDEDDYYSDEYDDDEYDDEPAQGSSMQPYQPRSADSNPSGGMNVIDKKEPSMLDQEGMKLRLELNLEIEVELKARIHGDLTLALM